MDKDTIENLVREANHKHSRSTAGCNLTAYETDELTKDFTSLTSKIRTDSFQTGYDLATRHALERVHFALTLEEAKSLITEIVTNSKKNK